MHSGCRMLCLAAVATFGAADAAHAQVELTFDDVSTLVQYAPLGVHFGENISLWHGGSCSVLDDPNCGPVTPPRGICVGNCGGVVGTITFDAPVAFASIYALSGPGPDNITQGTSIRCYNADGEFLGEALADTSVQFDLLTVRAPGITRLELISFFPSNEAWDNLSFGDACAADWNADGTINSQDFFDFLNSFFNDDADFNADGTTNSQDFFDFLAAFFAGC